MSLKVLDFVLYIHADSGVVRIDPLCFLAGCRKRRLNQDLSVLCASIGYFMCVLFIKATFVLTLVCVCMFSVSWLLLVKLSVLAN